MKKVKKMKGLFGGVTYDALDGVKLFNGDVVEIKWPDGNVAKYVICIDARTKDSDFLAYIVDAYHGTTNRVYLRWKKDAEVKFVSQVENTDIFGSMKK